MRRITVFIISASLLLSCVKGKEESQISYGTFTTRVEWADTKTELKGSSIHFGPDEVMTITCEGFNKFVVSNKESESPNTFQGSYRIKGESGSDCKWYATYPESIEVNGSGVITGLLPSVQTAPFDPTANLMYSDVIMADYDEDSPPEISFVMNQMMGLVRISFINGDDEYANDILQSVQLRASVPLCGEFSKDIHSGDLSFDGNTDQYVTSLYSSEETLGVNTQHWVTLFMNPVEITGAELIIRTDHHTFTYASPHAFKPIADTMTLLPLMDIKNFVVKGTKKSIVCWGDSYTSANYEEKATYCKHLQNLLGEEWTVYNGGRSGDRTYEIAARQGGLPIVTGEAFTIPAGTNSIRIGGLLRTHNVLNESGYFPFRRFYGAFINPCRLIGTNGEEVLCKISGGRTISGQDTTYYTTLSRLNAGSPVEIAEHTLVETYGARELRNADLTIIYMGANGTFGADNDKKYTLTSRWDNLAFQHWEMIKFTHNSGSYLVLGRHNAPDWDEKGYSTYMESQFGNRYLNLRLPVVESEESIKYWLLYSGAYADEREIPQKEIEYVLNGNWPRPLSHTPTDTHPNDFGAKVIAKIVYDRMVELGYVNPSTE